MRLILRKCKKNKQVTKIDDINEQNNELKRH